MDVSELKRKLDGGEGVLVLDVRDGADYCGKNGHIHGSLNLPLADFEGRMSDLEAWRERPIAVVCHSDKKSTKAVDLLSSQGFSDVVLVDGGLRDWSHAGFPVEREEMTK